MKYKQSKKTFNLQKLSYPKQGKNPKGLYVIKTSKMNIFNDLIHHWYNIIYHGIALRILGILLEKTKNILTKAISKR